jgi:hypothetical protein
MNCASDPSLLEIEPRPCEFCGLTIDHHRMTELGEEPEFFCLESAETVGWLAARKYTSTNGKPFALGFNTGIDFAIKHLVRQESAAMVEAPPIVPADRDPPRYRTRRRRSTRSNSWWPAATFVACGNGWPIGRRTRRFCSLSWKAKSHADTRGYRQPQA